MPYIFLDQFLSEAYMKQKQVFNYISMIINIVIIDKDHNSN